MRRFLGLGKGFRFPLRWDACSWFNVERGEYYPRSCHFVILEITLCRELGREPGCNLRVLDPFLAVLVLILT